MQQTKTMIYGLGKLYLVNNYILTLLVRTGKFVCRKQDRLENLVRNAKNPHKIWRKK